MYQLLPREILLEETLPPVENYDHRPPAAEFEEMIYTRRTSEGL